MNDRVAYDRVANVKVLLVVIDAATPGVVCPAITTGRLPVLHRLADAGRMHQACITIFPSLTPAATASIITGAYPAEHGIGGASWYDDRAKEVVYYGDDIWMIARKGFGPFLRDFLVGLNGNRLTTPTMFELVERAGRPAACLNYLVFRGDVPHRVRVPPLMKIVPRTRIPATVDGPSLLRLGDFVPGPERRRITGDKRGPLHRFGMDDAATRAVLCRLASQGTLPDFSVAYFADNDYRSHQVGPHAALPVVERVDAALNAVFDAAGGIERFLMNTCVVVTSDHGHCDVLSDRARAAVRLDRTLAEFRQATLGRPWRGRDEILICPNLRSAQIYVREPSPARIERIAAAAIAEPGVDQVIWRAALTNPEASGYVVATARGRLEFRRAASGPDVARDSFGTRWGWHGESRALDVARDRDAIVFDSYPNAFERIANTLDLDQSGEMWLTAQPGCEFELRSGTAHAGGASHGALHALDSLCPVIVAGGGREVPLPRDLRSVDIAPLCLSMLGVRSRYAVGDPRGIGRNRGQR